MREVAGTLSVPRNTAEPKQGEALEQVAKQVERAFKEGGLEPMSDPFLDGHTVERNVEVEIAGNSGHLFVIGARYDADPGGISVLVELATRLSRGGVVPRHTLRIVAFSGKLGQSVYAARCKARGETLEGALLLDGVGGSGPLNVKAGFMSRKLATEVSKGLISVAPVKHSALPALFPARRTAFSREGWEAVKVSDRPEGRADFARLERIAAALVDFVR